MAQRTRNLRNGTLKIKGGGSGQELTIPIDEGQLRFTVRKAAKVIMNRGAIAGLGEPNEEPMQVSFSCGFEEWTGRTLTAYASIPSVYDALHKKGNASSWTSTSDCGPYTVDLEFTLANPCTTSGVDQAEVITFPKFHADDNGFEEGDVMNMQNFSGICAVVEPTAVRS